MKPIWMTRVVLLACVVLLAAGCATTEETKRALTGYVQAMDDVERSANVFLTDFSDGLKVQKDLERVGGGAQLAAPPPYPTEFVLPPDPNVPQTDIEKALAQNRQALVVVRQYNEALVALAEGHSEQEVRARATELGAGLQTLATIAGTAIPGVALFTSVGVKVIKLAQDAHNRQQLEAAVMEGRESVGKILLAFEAQTPAMYALSVVGTRQAQLTLRREINRVAVALRPVVARHGPPADADLGGRMATFQARLSEIGRKTDMLKVMPIPLPYSNGSPPFDATSATETDVFMASLLSTTQKYDEVIAKQKAYHDALTKYVLALRQARRSLDLVAESLTKPVDLRAEAARLLKVSFELRDAMNAYRNPSVSPVTP